MKWNVEKLEVLDRVPTYYSIGHLSVPGGDSKKPWGKYAIAYNKDHQGPLPAHRTGAGPERKGSSSASTATKMELLLTSPPLVSRTTQSIPAELVKPREEVLRHQQEQAPYLAKGEKETKIERKGKARYDIWMTTIRSHFTPTT